MADDLELGAFPGLTPTDRENLAGGDENFKPHSWENLKVIIGSKNVSHSNRLGLIPLLVSFS